MRLIATTHRGLPRELGMDRGNLHNLARKPGLKRGGRG